MNANIIRKKYACSLRLGDTCATGIRCVVHMLCMHSLEHLCHSAVTFSSYWCPQMKTSLVWNCHPHNEARKSPADFLVRAAASLLQKERNKTSLLQKERKKKLCRQKKKATRRHCVLIGLPCRMGGGHLHWSVFKRHRSGKTLLGICSF